jgi:hypothetical protein
VESDKILKTTDRLHTSIVAEFEKTIKQPLLDFMRRKA